MGRALFWEGVYWVDKVNAVWRYMYTHYKQVHLYNTASSIVYSGGPVYTNTACNKEVAC